MHANLLHSDGRNLDTTQEEYYKGDADPGNPVSWGPIMGIVEPSAAGIGPLMACLQALAS